MTCRMDYNANKMWESTDGSVKPVLVDISDPDWMNSLSTSQLFALYDSLNSIMKIRMYTEGVHKRRPMDNE